MTAYQHLSAGHRIAGVIGGSAHTVPYSTLYLIVTLSDELGAAGLSILKLEL